MSLTSETRDAITRAATEAGLDPAMALATAERESDFNVHERSRSSSAYGTFQLLKAERDKYGGNSADPYEQAQAWGRYIQGTKAEMAKVLGREPTGAELYAGHYWGGPRAARIVGGHVAPETPVAEVFTPRELAANPDLARAGTVGALKDSVLADMNRRLVRYGGEGAAPDLTGYGTPVNAGSFSNREDEAPQAPGPWSRGGEVDQSPAGRRAAAGDPMPFDAEVGKADRENAYSRWLDAAKSNNIIDRRGESETEADTPTVDDVLARRAVSPTAPSLARSAGINDIGRGLQPLPSLPPPLPTSPPPGATPAWGLPQQ